MVKRCCHPTVAAILAGVALTGPASAQNSEPACSVGINHFVGYGSMRQSNLAYTATAKMTFEQRLPDGNDIRGYIYTHQARDSAGRTMSEMGQGCQLDENGVPQPQLSVSVFDPTTKTSLHWQVGIGPDKVARVSHQLDTPRKTLTPSELAAIRKSAESRQPPRSEFKSEDLGTRTIAGVEAQGERTTRTIPAGDEGNRLPLVTTSETWNSKEFGLVVLGISDDPRRGRTTYEIEELSRTEPDPSLFTPPEGYRIEDSVPLSASGSQQ
jgi:hypothetical protein